MQTGGQTRIRWTTLREKSVASPSRKNERPTHSEEFAFSESADLDPSGKAIDKADPISKRDPNLLQRPHVIVLFAIVVIWLTQGARADDAAENTAGRGSLFLQFKPDEPSILPGNNSRSPYAQAPSSRERPSVRSSSAALVADLANFDSDADPDGWVAQVRLAGVDLAAVTSMAQARFELTPRIALADANQFTASDHRVIRWNKSLRFSSDGVATTELKLNQPIDPLLGVPARIASTRSTGRRSGRPGRSGSVSRRSSSIGYGAITSSARTFGNPTLPGGLGRNDRGNRIRLTRQRMSAGTTWFDQVNLPSQAVLRVRVSIAGLGVRDATTVVRLRPTPWNDNQWPYR